MSENVIDVTFARVRDESSYFRSNKKDFNFAESGELYSDSILEQKGTLLKGDIRAIRSDVITLKTYLSKFVWDEDQKSVNIQTDVVETKTVDVTYAILYEPMSLYGVAPSYNILLTKFDMDAWKSND